MCESKGSELFVVENGDERADFKSEHLDSNSSS